MVTTSEGFPRRAHHRGLIQFVSQLRCSALPLPTPFAEAIQSLSVNSYGLRTLHGAFTSVPSDNPGTIPDRFLSRFGISAVWMIRRISWGNDGCAYPPGDRKPGRFPWGTLRPGRSDSTRCCQGFGPVLGHPHGGLPTSAPPHETNRTIGRRTPSSRISSLPGTGSGAVCGSSRMF